MQLSRFVTATKTCPSDYLTQAFSRRKVNMKSLMKTVTLNMIVINVTMQFYS